MNYTETMGYLEEMTRYGSVLGLDNMINLLTELGNPQESLRFIHIAGTNGKGSLLAFLSTILTEAGYRVGRYLSPTIFEYRERIQVGAVMISKQALSKYMTRVREAIDRMLIKGEAHPTVFEVETALAFLYFRDRKCDIVVLETGLGGTLDATNVIRNTVVAVLTPISMDHMEYLGDTIEKIAQSKAGIIKKGCSVISAAQQKEAREVISKRCSELSCPLCFVLQDSITKVKNGIRKQGFSYAGIGNAEITLAGTYQIANAALAAETVLALRRLGYAVTDEALKRGLCRTVWEGRFTQIAEKPLFIVDGAHNEAAAVQLAESICFYFANKKVIYIMGILKDKEYDKIIRETYRYADQIITVAAPDNTRAIPAYELAQAVREYHDSVTAADSLSEAVEMSYLLADRDSVIIAFGSLSYLGELCHIVKKRDEIRRDSHGRSD